MDYLFLYAIIILWLETSHCERVGSVYLYWVLGSKVDWASLYIYNNWLFYLFWWHLLAETVGWSQDPILGFSLSTTTNKDNLPMMLVPVCSCSTGEGSRGRTALHEKSGRSTESRRLSFSPLKLIEIDWLLSEKRELLVKEESELYVM